MAKKSFLNKFAEKLLNNDKIGEAMKSAWQAQSTVFGPIMEPAFVGDDAARIELAAAINMIQRREIKKALKKLDHMHKFCKNDADETAWLFFAGLAFDQAQDAENAVACWVQAVEYKPKFYLLYMKLARYLYLDAMYDPADEYYREAIDCLINHPMQEGVQNASFIASAYTNLASNLVMMHRLDEAIEALNEAEKWHPSNPEREYVWAIIYALQEDFGKAAVCLYKLKNGKGIVPEQMVQQTESVIKDIQNRTHAHFFVVPGEREYYPEFWKEFSRCEKEMFEDLHSENGGAVVEQLDRMLQPLFPFMHRDLAFGIMTEGDKCTVEFSDFYVKSLNAGYKELVELCPNDLKKRWNFEIIH